MKPKIKTDSTENAAQLPTVDTLASLAAQSRFAKLPGARAAQAALELWRESQAAIASEQRQADLCREYYVAPLEHLRLPKTWPASFADFLKCAVQGKDAGEQQHRFKEFLRMKIAGSPKLFGVKGKPTEKAMLDALEEQLKEFKANTYSREAWQNLALEFRRYWKGRDSETKSRAGKKGAAVKAAKKAAKSPPLK